MEKTYEEYKGLIDRHLLDLMPAVDSKSNTLYEAMKYSLSSGGKRLRPVLLLACCEFAGGNALEALPYAAAIEYIHTYSLIHDDLPAMDNDDLRRGKPTNHKVYGDAMAILAGDGLLSTAFEIMARDMTMYLDDMEQLKKRTRAMNIIAKGSGVRGMVAGQSADIENEENRVSNEMLEYIHTNKTGALIKAAIMAGLYMGNPDDRMIDSFSQYADNFGLAFQISDDILDVVGDVKVMGKNPGQDTKDNKNTYTSLNGLDKAYEVLDILLKNALDSIEEYYDNAEFFADLANKLRVRDK
ncbi:MAG: polyprenyl synthetase family protein [Firmicutes bacterium]|nr:polyprenyl synthetase family protein [Bacillota bacterium]